MANVNFRLANGANISETILYSVAVATNDVPDEWFQDVQEYFATHLPPSITWATVHKYSLEIEDFREVDPNP